MFERFTDRARRVLVLAQDEALLLQHGFIGTEHLLLGLIHEGEGVAARALADLEVTLEAVRERVEDTIGLSGTAPTGSPPFTPRAKKVLELSLREAMQLGHNYIGTEHMLLGLVREGEGVAAQVLVSMGADLARVRQHVIQLLSGYQGKEPVGAEAVSMSSRTSWSQLSLSGSQQSALVECSFCGRQPPESGKLVSGRDAYICEHCVREWSEHLPRGTGHIATGRRFTLNLVPATGPPPADEESARIDIEDAFARLADVSDDGSAVPSVEGGELLGPCLRAARERHAAQRPDDQTHTLEEIVFVDDEHAAVWFTILRDGRPLLSRYRGDAVLVDGTWKVARTTFCELMRLAGVECPPI